MTNNINSNSTTLIKVIAAVLKFTPQQTQVVLEKEAHRKSLVRMKTIFEMITSNLLNLHVNIRLFFISGGPNKQPVITKFREYQRTLFIVMQTKKEKKNKNKPI